MTRNLLITIALLAVMILASACGGGPAAPAAAPAATPPEGKLTVTSSSAFIDQFGSYHVVGSVTNGTNSSLTSIELSFAVKDAAGNSLLKDSQGTLEPNRVLPVMLDNLAPGEVSPFDFTYDLANGAPASYSVTVAGYQSVKTQRAALKVENVQLTDDKKGSLYLTGRLVNSASQWVRVNSLAGAVVGGSENPLSAGASFIHVTLLAPAGDPGQRDQTPFVVSFPSPGSGQTDWRLYLDADQAEAPTEYPVDVNFTNSYFDQSGAYHIVGFVTNKSNDVINPLLVAGLYAEDGTVLDSAYTFYSVTVQPGNNLPFDMSYFGSVNTIPEQAARVRTFTVQADPARTQPPEAQSVELTAAEDRVEHDGSVWKFTGSVTNTAAQNLSGATVIVSIYDGQKNLVATNSAYLLPTGSAITPGDVVRYAVSVNLDPTVDSGDFQTATMVIGDISK